MTDRTATELTDHLLLALAAGELGTWRWERSSGITTWDTTMELLFGLEPGTFDGTLEAWIALVHPDDAAHCRAVIERAIADRSPYRLEHRVIWPDGSIHWLQGRGMVTLDAQGDVTGTIGCAGDVTARKFFELESAERVLQAERLASAERRQRERLEFLTELHDTTRSAADHRQLMQAVAAAAVPRLGDWCAVIFVPEAGVEPAVEIAHSDPDMTQWARELQLRYPYDPDSTFGVAAVIRSGTTEFVSNVGDDLIDHIIEASSQIPRDELRAVLGELQLSSIITVPLKTRRGTVGAMQFVNAESGRHYDEADVALAEAAAIRIADALDDTWLGDQHRSISAALQTALLPPRLPAIDGVRLAARYWPAGFANRVGGDFYDIFPVGQDRWALVIGDVCGTGPDAAAVTSIVRHTIRAAATHGASHVEVLEWVNDALHAGKRELFATVLYATLERLDTGAWRYTSITGGHPLPILVPLTGPPTIVGATGTLVGALPVIHAEPFETEFHEGDTLVLYTDGVTDVRPPHQLDPEDFTRLAAAAISPRTTDSAERMIGHLVAAISKIVPLEERRDDIALVVVHFETPR